MSIGEQCRRNALLTSVFLILVSGCATRPILAPPPRWQIEFDAAWAKDILRVGDTIEISFGDAPPSRSRIAEDGVVRPPLNLTVIGTNKTASVLQEEIRNLYVPNYYDHLEVTVRRPVSFFMER